MPFWGANCWNQLNMRLLANSLCRFMIFYSMNLLPRGFKWTHEIKTIKSLQHCFLMRFTVVDVSVSVQVKWCQFSWAVYCVSRLTVSLHVAPSDIYHTCQSGAHKSTMVSSGMGQRKCCGLPQSITLAGSCHLASNVFFTTSTDWSVRICTVW